ncbi:MAG TPA: hypothetical protein DCF33_15635, partial [Saprospirales bacterium]|nr:hypothetical protein [Saprospirales bacterium]
MENNTVDRGWNAMQQMLDREMPVKKRRRAAWWWLSLLLLPLAILAGWWHQQQPKGQNAPREEMPVTNWNDTHKMARETAPSTPEIVLSMTSYSSIKTTTVEEQPEEYTQKPSTPTGQPSTQAKVQLLETQSPLAGITDPATPAPIQIGMIPVAPQLVGSLTPKSEIQPQPIPTAISIQKGKPDFKSFWTIGATSIASTERFTTINGFSTGVTADWAIARKWGLRAGLMYNIHTPEKNHRPVVAVNSDIYTDNLEGEIIARNVATGAEVTSVPGTNTLADSLNGQVYIPVSRIQRVELPIMVYWQASRPLKVFGGLSFVRTLNTKADRLNYSGEYQLTLNDQIAEDEISNISDEAYKSWNVNAMLGLGLRVSSVFELGMQGTLPFQRFTNMDLLSKNGTLTNNGVRIKS